MRFFTLFISLLFSSVAFSQVKDGYYRVQNAGTGRYLYVMDNRGSVNMTSASADVGAIIPWSGFEKTIPDAATIIYVEAIEGGYKFYGQGTNTYEIIPYPINVVKHRDNDGTFWCFASAGVISLYLDDNEDDETEPQGSLQTVGLDIKRQSQKWNVLPVDVDSDNYFGIKPTVQANGKYYKPFYADFGFSFKSPGMKAYKIVSYGEGYAIKEEITSEVIPAETPVIIECSSNNMAENKINVIRTANSTDNTNVLAGNFFRNGENKKDTYTHKNVTPYNPATMRVLGVMPDGSLGLVTTSDKYLEANAAYLPVANISGDLKIYTQEEYEATKTVDVAAIALDKTELMLKKGETQTLAAVVSPDNATDKTVTWSSSNDAVATVTADGLVTAVAAGSAVITATSSNGLTATCKVNVTVDAAAVNLNKTAVTLEKGTQETLVATVEPEDATDKTLAWSSSNDAVATVSADGVVSAIAEGNAVITVATVNGLTATCEVTVEDNNSAVAGIFADPSENDAVSYTIGGAYVGKSTGNIQGIVVKKGKKVLLKK